MDEAEWNDWLVGLVKAGAAEFGVDTVGEPVFGARGRTVGSRVAMASAGPARWLRVVTERRGFGGGPMWTGNVEADAIAGVARPHVHAVTEWAEAGRDIRAELMTLVVDRPLSSEVALRGHVPAGARWWGELRRSLDIVAGSATDRVCLDADLVQRRLLAAFGVEIVKEEIVWSTAHGDLHWANVTGPACWLLDWEAWGIAPAGYDAATLYCSSLLQPEVANQVSKTFGDLLGSTSGAVATLAAIAKLLDLVEYGEHPDLAVPLHREARMVLRRHFADSSQ